MMTMMIDDNDDDTPQKGFVHQAGGFVKRLPMEEDFDSEEEEEEEEENVVDDSTNNTQASTTKISDLIGDAIGGTHYTNKQEDVVFECDSSFPQSSPPAVPPRRLTPLQERLPTQHHTQPPTSSQQPQAPKPAPSPVPSSFPSVWPYLQSQASDHLLSHLRPCHLQPSALPIPLFRPSSWWKEVGLQPSRSSKPRFRTTSPCRHLIFGVNKKVQKSTTTPRVSTTHPTPYKITSSSATYTRHYSN